MGYVRALVAGSMALAIGVGAAEAEACGGTFCDRPTEPGAPPMPVDQSGENVVFVMDSGRVEAHVQIQYEGDPDRFAWVIPVPALPEVRVGSQQMFVNLLNATVPTYSRTTNTLFCSSNGDVTGRSSTSSGAGCGMPSASDDSYAFGDGSGGSGGDSSTVEHSDTVVMQSSVGSFDVTVLDGETVEEVTTWLDDNDFLVDDEAVPILADYVDRQHLFVAIKLTGGAGLDEIHPLVFSYEGTEPCIPLKLTAIAATEDMGVRAFFLGERRVVPTSFKHVRINEAQIDWRDPGRNYVDVVSRAVDSPVARGRAFVTEYAGSTTPVDTSNLHDPRWDAEVFRDLEPTAVVAELGRQGLADCPSRLSCVVSHPMLVPMLRAYLPVPDGLEEADFYSCPACYAEQIDLEAWDGNAFADDFETLIAEPGRRAVEMISGSSYLTRLFTTISPAEMTEDPMFAEAEGLPQVSASRTATETVSCSSLRSMRVPGTREVALGGSRAWPVLDVPDAAVVEEFTAEGDYVLLVDNSRTIDDAIAANNRAQGYPYPVPSGSNGPNGSSANERAVGCGCRTHLERTSQGYLLAGFLALFFVRRFRGRVKAG